MKTWMKAALAGAFMVVASPTVAQETCGVDLFPHVTAKADYEGIAIHPVVVEILESLTCHRANGAHRSLTNQQINFINDVQMDFYVQDPLKPIGFIYQGSPQAVSFNSYWSLDENTRALDHALAMAINQAKVGCIGNYKYTQRTPNAALDSRIFCYDPR